MTERGAETTGLAWLRGSGLDTTNGAEFVQERLALFARLVTTISGAFLALGLVTGIAFEMPVWLYLTGRGTIANFAGLAFLAILWLVCRRGQLSLALLELLDAAALVGSCAAWAFFIEQRFSESVFAAVISVTMTILVRAIIVPSKARRTLHLSLLAVAPTLVMLWLWLAAARGPAAASVAPYAPWLTAINQTLLLVAVVWLATITSRILYDLRRSVREANELGQYALEEMLGAGGMGEVWRARHRFLVRAAAVKLIRPELLASSPGEQELLMRRFEREALATAALRSPHTVQLYDFGQADDGTIFYVMELLLGIDLEKLVARFGPVPAERAIHILKQVCHSLDEAHQNGLTHRDIKPANVFVSGIGSELDFVKVLDFGLVRFRPEQISGEKMKLTAQGRVGGTPAYTAPEIAMDAGYDHRVDLYAVGCVGYWLLTGKLVFQSDSMVQMIIDHARTTPPRPQTRTHLPIPADLEQIIMDCLEKDPARRPASAAELADRLSSVELGQQWTRERAESWWREHMPQSVEKRPVAEVLLSREAGPPSVRELRPRRDQRPARDPTIPV